MREVESRESRNNSTQFAVLGGIARDAKKLAFNAIAQDAINLAHNAIARDAKNLALNAMLKI